MSNILRRPMFRMGGQVNSQGTGIMSGLEPRANYDVGGSVYLPTTSLEDLAKQREKEKKLAGIVSRIPTYEDVVQEAEQDYQKEINKLQSQIDMYVSPEDYFMGEQAAQKLNLLQSPEGKKTFIGEQLAEREAQIKAAENAGVPKEQLPKTAKQIVTPPKTEKPDEPPKPTTKQTPTTTEDTRESDVKAIYEDLLPLFKKELGPDADEFRRQKYMQLAKFGLGLLAQPGGSLVEAIGRAGEKPLAGLESAAARQAQAERAPRLAALEIAAKQAEPGKYRQAVNDLVKMGIPRERAIKIVTEQGTGTRAQLKQKVIEANQDALTDDISKSAARKAALKMSKNNLSYSDFEMMPTDKSGKIDTAKLAEKGDGYYYDEKGNIYSVIKGKLKEIK